MSDPTNEIDEAALAAYRQQMAAKVAQIKEALLKWIEPRDSVTDTDSVCMTNALFEVALDRHVTIHDANGFDLIEAAYRRALQRRRGSLQ